MKPLRMPRDGSSRSPINWSVVIFITISMLIGSVYSPFVMGACLGYILGYHLILRKRKQFPSLYPLPKAMQVYSGSGCIGLGLIMVFLPEVNAVIPLTLYDVGNPNPDGIAVSRIFHVLVTILTLYGFLWWRNRTYLKVREQHRHGTARYITKGELKPYRKKSDKKNSVYVGGRYIYYNRQGHMLTIAGTRAGKGIYLIIPNLLGASNFNGSMVIVDVKGENAAISADYQRSLGKTVRILNPWGLLDLPSTSYNPFDLISDSSSEHLPDDAQLLAQMIVPSTPNNDDHWNNRARSLITAILMHMATALPDEDLHPGVLWGILRNPTEEWLSFLRDMALNDHPVSGHIINGAANEILSIMENSEREATSIISTAQRWTDVFKSIPLQQSLEHSDFSINELSDGNTVLYVIIPADKLKTHYAWLRLVVTTAMKAVVRKPNQRVMFLLDEFYALGYLQEIEVALGTYAGYGITIWAILQSLVQLQDLYGKNWENFIANSSVIQAFGINDHTTAKYISEMTGRMSVSSYGKGNALPHGSSQRALLTPDEVRRLGNNLLCFIDNLPTAYLPKLPYYEHPVWKHRAQPNPYYRGE